jgi:hypothetical protein
MNKKVWELYKTSNNGNKIIKLFDTNSDDFDESTLFKYFESLGNTNDNVDEYDFWSFKFFVNQEQDNILPQNINFDEFLKFVSNYELKDYYYDDNNELLGGEDLIFGKDDYRNKMWMMVHLSIFLYQFYDGLFFPILYPRRFDIIQKNCDALGIELPEIPRSKDYMEYILYYWDLCESLSEFKEDNNLTRAEVCAALYDFAPLLLAEENTEDVSLPTPTNVWLTGAGGKNGDYDSLEEMAANKSYEADSIWTCNEQTRKGDIILFYSTAPYSCISHIGRAKTEGFVNPFDYYGHSTTVCDIVKLDIPITLKDLKADNYLSKMTIVRQGMRGVNGKECSPKDYAELMRFEKESGGSVEKWATFYETANMDFGKIKVEKDVEENILIPYLLKLGYTEQDWTRQLSLKAGRGLKAIPDFVFFAHGDKHMEAAPFVIEAKLDMSSMLERRKAFSQCQSYARLLRSRIMAICDKNRIVVYTVTNEGFANYENPIFEQQWAAVYSDPIIGPKLRKLIGRDAILEKR